MRIGVVLNVGLATLAFGAPVAAARSLPIDGAIEATLTPGTGGAYTVAGILTSKGMRGRYRVKATQTGDRFTGTFTYCDRFGSFRGTNAGHSTGQTGSVVSFVDSLRVTGGTGRYRNAHGRLSERGTTDLSTMEVAETVEGRLTIAGGSSTAGRCSVPAP